LLRLFSPAPGPSNSGARSLRRPQAYQSAPPQAGFLQALFSLASGGLRPALLTDYFKEGVGELRKRLVVYERFFVLFDHQFGALLKGRNRCCDLGVGRSFGSKLVWHYVSARRRRDGR